MAAGRIIIPNVMPALDINGNPVAGAKLTFYANETTTLQAVYTTSALTVAHPNPITADAAGAFASIFADTSVAYSVAITDADNAPIVGLRNRDNVKASLFFGDDYIDTAALKANNLSDLASASTARTNLGLGSIATQAASAVAITGGSITGITDLAVADGGTGASDASGARTNLGVAIGTNVQAYDANLTTWAGITPGTGVATALAVNVGSAGAFTTFNGAGGTPSSLTLTNATGLPVAGGGTGASTEADARTNLAVVGTAELAASGGSALVGFLQSGTGATPRTVQAKLREIQLTPNDFAGADADAKIAAAAAEAVATGAVLVLPPGTYDIDPITFVDAISVVGAGPNATILRAKTGGTGTLLDFAYNTTGYDSIIGGFTIDLSAAPTMDGLKANNIVRAVVDDVVVKQGAVGIYWLAGGECRFENIYCYDQTTSGFLVDGDNCGEMFYTNVLCRREVAGTTDVAFNIARTTATDTGGHYLTNVRSTRGAGTVNTGIRIGSTVANCAIFALLDRCVTDNTNGTGAGLVLRNCNSVWSVNGYHAGTATTGAVYIYAGQDIQFFGGRADNGAAGKSIHLDSGTIRFSSSNVHLNQGTAYYFTGSGPTAMCNQDILSSGITLTNDTTKLADASTEQRIRSPMSVITDPDGVALRSFTLYDPVNNTNVYMVSANGVWKVYNSGFNEIFTLDNAGSLALNSVLKVAGLQVVGAQGAAVADATGAGDVVAQLNALLARLRTHGLIAT